MTVMLVRLAFAGIRSRLLASALTIAIAAAAVATIVLALEVRSTGLDPWQRTFAEANGAHVLAFVPSQADAVAIGELPGVTERERARPDRARDRRPARDASSVQLAGLSRPPVVNTPRADRRLAAARGRHRARTQLRRCARPRGRRHARVRRRGDGSIELPVLGTAVVPEPGALPAQQPRPGLGHAGHARAGRARSLRAGAGQRRSGSRILRPLRPSPSGRQQPCRAASQPGTALFQTWQEQRDDALGDAQGTQVIVTMFTDPAADRRLRRRRHPRRRARQRAAPPDRAAEGRRLHATPGQHRLRARVRRARPRRGRPGLRARGVLAPRLAAPSAADARSARRRSRRTPGTSSSPAASCFPSSFAGAVTVHPPQHPLHRPRGDPCRAAARPPIRASRVPSPDPSLPLTIGLGLKDLLARGRRALLLAAAIALTGAVVVTALSLDATLDAQPPREASDFPDELLLLVYTLDTVLAADHRDHARCRRPALGPRAHPRLRRAQGDRPHARPDRLHRRQLPRRPCGARIARRRSRSASGSTSPSTRSPAARARTPSSHPGGRSR